MKQSSLSFKKYSKQDDELYDDQEGLFSGVRAVGMWFE